MSPSFVINNCLHKYRINLINFQIIKSCTKYFEMLLYQQKTFTRWTHLIHFHELKKHQWLFAFLQKENLLEIKRWISIQSLVYHSELKGELNCQQKVLLGITHFVKNNFVKNHKDCQKISGRSLCWKYLKHFGIFYQWNPGLGASEVLGDKRVVWGWPQKC